MRRWAPLLAVVLLAPACGTRLARTEIEAAAYGPRDPATADVGGGAHGASPERSVSADTAAASTVAGSSGTVPVANASSVSGSHASGAAATASGAPIVLGQLGTFSGILGPGGLGFRTAAQAWVAAVNAKGGINGHPVKLISKDDGSDGAKGLSEVKEMVESEHVVAFVASELINSGTAIRAYLEQHRIPVVGGDVYDEFWHESPMLFPEAEYIDSLHYATAASAVQAGKKSFALMWCAEVPACGAAVPYWQSSIAKLGGRVVYKAQVSIAAPDYTAQCLQAQQNGADALWVGADGATLSRIANSCARQNYHPAIAAAAGTLDPEFPQNPNLQGFRGAVQVFPWFLTSGSPALEEYGAVMKQYAPDAPLQASTAQGWASAKLFQKVALSAIKAGDAPTSDAILRGLWSINNETLGGLTSPLTFVPNRPAARGTCSYIVGIDNGKWVAPNGLQLTCGTP